MSKLDTVRQLVEQRYAAKNADADRWNNWGYPNHVLKVAAITEQLAAKYGANAEQAIAGALLHDIADTEMSRKNPDHEKRSLQIAKDILKQADFGWIETQVIIEQIIGPHSCNDILPGSQEGKVMATADAVAHFTTDFYPYFCWQHLGPGDYAPFKAWVLKKIHKDFTRKIFFDDEREQVRTAYNAIETFFSL